jgi:hypothetical protein
VCREGVGDSHRPLYDLTVIDPVPKLAKGLSHKGSECWATPVITTKS